MDTAIIDKFIKMFEVGDLKIDYNIPTGLGKFGFVSEPNPICKVSLSLQFIKAIVDKCEQAAAYAEKEQIEAEIRDNDPAASNAYKEYMLLLTLAGKKDE